MLNTSCWRAVDLPIVISLSNSQRCYDFRSTLLSALHSSYHSIITILPSTHCYYPHFVQEKLPLGHTASSWQGHCPNPTLGAKSVFAIETACNTGVFRCLRGQTRVDVSSLRNKQYTFTIELPPLSHQEGILGEMPEIKLYRTEFVVSRKILLEAEDRMTVIELGEPGANGGN